MLVTRAWEEIDDSDTVVFVVDAAKRLSFEVKEALIRLKKTAARIDPELKQIQDAIESEAFTEEQFLSGRFQMDDKDKRF